MAFGLGCACALAWPWLAGGGAAARCEAVAAAQGANVAKGPTLGAFVCIRAHHTRGVACNDSGDARSPGTASPWAVPTGSRWRSGVGSLQAAHKGVKRS